MCFFFQTDEELSQNCIAQHQRSLRVTTADRIPSENIYKSLANPRRRVHGMHWKS